MNLPNHTPEQLEKYFFHRSGQEAMQRCPRMAYYEYAYLGIGIHLSPRAIWFDVGIAVHYGIGDMLSAVPPKEAIENALRWFQDDSGQTEEKLGFRFWEQQTLIEALLWSFATYALPSILDTYEILFVERQIVCERDAQSSISAIGEDRVVIVNVSRPDVIARDKQTGEIAVLNWKTINDITTERREHQLRGLQGFREHYFSEVLLQRLRYEISEELQNLSVLVHTDPKGVEKLQSMLDQIQKLIKLSATLPNDGRVDYTQFVYLVKGRRVREKSLADVQEGMLAKLEGVEDKEDSFDFHSSDSLNTRAANFQEEADWTTKDWRQDSFLVYPWIRQQAAGAEQHLNAKGKIEYTPHIAWQYRYKKPDQVSFHTLGTGYKRELVYLLGSTQEFVEKLHAKKVFPSSLDYSLPNPLSKIIVFENPLYRDERMMQGLLTQLQVQEMDTVRRLRAVDQIRQDLQLNPELYAENPDLLQVVVDEKFPQHLHNCLSPTRCQFHSFCHGKLVGKIDHLSIPVGYELRVSHHYAEQEYLESKALQSQVVPQKTAGGESKLSQNDSDERGRDGTYIPADDDRQNVSVSNQGTKKTETRARQAGSSQVAWNEASAYKAQSNLRTSQLIQSQTERRVDRSPEYSQLAEAQALNEQEAFSQEFESLRQLEEKAEAQEQEQEEYFLRVEEYLATLAEQGMSAEGIAEERDRLLSSQE